MSNKNQITFETETDIRDFLMARLGAFYGVNVLSRDQEDSISDSNGYNMARANFTNSTLLENKIKLYETCLQNSLDNKTYGPYVAAIIDIIFLFLDESWGGKVFIKMFINKLMTDLKINENDLNKMKNSKRFFGRILTGYRETATEQIQNIFIMCDFLKFTSEADANYQPIQPKDGGWRKQINKSQIPKASEKRVQINGEKRNRIVFIGNRGKEYIKMSGEFVSLSVAKKMKSKK